MTLLDESLAGANRRAGVSRAAAFVLGCVVVWALAAGVLPGTASAALTNHFLVTNYTTYTLRLKSVTAPPSWFAGGVPVDETNLEGRPPDGSPLAPGASDAYEMIFDFFKNNGALATYSVRDASGHEVGTLFVSMLVGGFRGIRTDCQLLNGSASAPDISAGRDAHAPAGLRCTAGLNNTSVGVIEPPGTVHAVPASLKQQQADYLRALCQSSSVATCSFTAKKDPEHLLSPRHQVGGGVPNPDEKLDVRTKVTAEDTVGQSNSVEVAVTAGGELFKLINLEIEARYGHEWTEEHKFSQEIELKVPAGNVCYIYALSPIIRYTGDFTAKMGNSTWNLTDIYFDGPDTTPQAAKWRYDIQCEKLTAAQRTAALQDKPTGATRVLRDTYSTAAAAAASIARPRLELRIAGPTTLRSGRPAAFTVLLDDTSPDRRLTYALRNVRVRVAVGKRGARQWLVRNPVDDTVRRLRFTTRIPSRARSICVQAQATANHAVSAEDTRCQPVTGGSGG